MKIKYLYFFVFLTFLIISAYNFISGIYMSSDSYRFSRWADILVKFNFNFFDFYMIDKADNRPHLFFFSIPVLLISICKFIFNNEWQFFFLILNLLLLFFSLLCFTKTLLIIGVKPLLIFASLPLLIISADLLTWPRYVLSDLIYSFLVILSVYLVTKAIVIQKINYLNFLIIIFLLLATRPSSMPVVFAILVFILLLKFKFLLEKKIILKALLFLIFLFPFVFSVIFFLIENFNYINNLKYLTSMVKVGMIIHDRPETWISPPSDFFNVVLLYFFRFLYFFSPVALGFSTLHVIFNIIQFVAIITSICGWIIFTNINENQHRVFTFILLLSFCVAAFHSFTLIDYDWRFRFPLILPLLMLFPISLSMFLEKKNLN